LKYTVPPPKLPADGMERRQPSGTLPRRTSFPFRFPPFPTSPQPRMWTRSWTTRWSPRSWTKRAVGEEAGAGEATGEVGEEVVCVAVGELGDSRQLIGSHRRVIGSMLGQIEVEPETSARDRPP
jgi:hypothetical protein